MDLKPLLLIIMFIFCLKFMNAQTNIKDSINHLEEVIITATKSERKLSNVTVPVQIINKKYILQTGAIKLSDILTEQSSLQVFNSGFGEGVQLQGLNPDYTLILLNGEPIIGRNSGVIDLNRIAINNIKKIEIVKGPSSSLYGSEALAGVINIITEDNNATQFNVNLKMGNYNLLQSIMNGGFNYKKFFYNGSFNFTQSNAFITKPFTNQRYLTPTQNVNQLHNIRWEINKKNNIIYNIRVSEDKTINKLAVNNNGSIIESDGSQQNNDINNQIQWVHTFNSNFKTTQRIYYSYYNSTQDLNTLHNLKYTDMFSQNFVRFENQTNFKIKNIDFNVGIGLIDENVKTNRYDSVLNWKNNHINYTFLQAEYNYKNKFIFIVGTRCDDNTLYSSAFSPKISFKFNISKKIAINASIGKGFKAPDFRQLYLNFSNNAAGGYTVLGTENVANYIKNNLITSFSSAYYNLKKLEPETSVGINIGVIINPIKNIQSSINFFRNDINNFIDFQTIATQKNGQNIYSYFNLKAIYTQGFETNVQYNFLKNYSINFGYQYLETAIKTELEEIKTNTVYYRTLNGNILVLKTNDYLGLANRSKHQLSIQCSYSKDNLFFANIRCKYRSNWGINDTNGNNFIDVYDNLASGYALINFSVGKNFNKQISAQIGINNVTNYEDAINIPSLLNRNYYILINYSLFKNKKS